MDSWFYDDTGPEEVQETMVKEAQGDQQEFCARAMEGEQRVSGEQLLNRLLFCLLLQLLLLRCAMRRPETCTCSD